MIDAQEQVILVDSSDNAMGLMGKIEAHKAPHLHRAFSLLIFNEQGEMLLQQRAKSKYHSPLLWTNACCSHPRQGETVEQAAVRRSAEELNLAVHSPKRIFSFIYKAQLDHGMFEHEYDHVLSCTYSDTLPKPNPDEVANLRWIDKTSLVQEIEATPERFTAWFKILISDHLDHIYQHI